MSSAASLNLGRSQNCVLGNGLMTILILFADTSTRNTHFFFRATTRLFNSLTNDTILDYSKLKPFADDKVKLTQNLKFVLERIENIVGKGENAGSSIRKRIPEKTGQFSHL